MKRKVNSNNKIRKLYSRIFKKVSKVYLIIIFLLFVDNLGFLHLNTKKKISTSNAIFKK